MIKNKSFTLIELLVVIVIIGILAGVIMISTSSSIDKASIAKSKVFDDATRNSLITNLISEWTFDTGTTMLGDATNADVIDYWGSNNGDITNHAPAILTDDSCVYGKCLYFDGTFNDYVQVSAITSLTTGSSFVLSSWVYPEHTNTYRSIIGYDSNHRLLIQADERMLSQQGSNFYSATGSVLNGKWTHVIYWCNGIEERWYINGVLSGSPQAMSVAEWNAAFKIGQYSLSYYPFKGRIDDVRIYNDAFSAQYIKKDYLSGLKSLLSKGSITYEEYISRINSLCKIN
ncbi:MAG TPA: prepilin-type N-terminal cleavage/methylation domain-containing protein [Candidatus Pacearchaeota archaeon]|nr:prepilin-type N-terminal cleavage/methylation domain-containing protein [Candidatus Pacearchaeota archaeon]